MEQAKELAHWYEGQGEQDASIWFEINGVETPMVNVRAKPWLVVDEASQTVTVNCK